MLIGLFFIASCAKQRSTKTGWEMNNPNQGGFEEFPAMDQETGPGLILVEGGTFTMGMTEEDVLKEWNNTPRRITVPSFYMDQTEVSNLDYLEYLYWVKRVYGSLDDGNQYSDAYTADMISEDDEEEDEEGGLLGGEDDDEGSSDYRAFGKYFDNYEESFTSNYQEVFRKALPDTLCWRDPLSAMEHFVDYYLRHPAYKEYPVVGVSWVQANDYCKWRTDRVNEYILCREGILDWEMNNKELNPFHMFNTEAYLAGQYFGMYPQPRESSRDYSTEDEEEEEEDDDEEIGKDEKFTKQSREDNGRRLKNYNPSYQSSDKNNGNYGHRIVRMEDGILLPNYRLPTEAEWEYAATGLIGNLQENSENYTDRRVYPWNGHWVRKEDDQFQGAMQANFQRGHGDYMGIAGNLNDGAAPTAPVESYWPNDFGLYHMAGNVSEWVQDIYRPLSLEDVADFSPFRGNVYKTKLTTSLGTNDAMKNDRVRYDVHGMREYTEEFERVRYQRIKGGGATQETGANMRLSKPTSGFVALKYDLDSIVGVSGKDGCSNSAIYETPFNGDGSSEDSEEATDEGGDEGGDEGDFGDDEGGDDDPWGGGDDDEGDFGDDDAGDDDAGGDDGGDASEEGETSSASFKIESVSNGGEPSFKISSDGTICYDKLLPPGVYKVNIAATEKDPSGADFVSKFEVVFNLLAKAPPVFSGTKKLVSSRNAAEFRNGYEPDPLYISSGKNLYQEGSQFRKELILLSQVNAILDSAIHEKNNLHSTQSSRIVQNDLFHNKKGVLGIDNLNRIFRDERGSYLEDPAVTNMVTMLRNGLTEYIIEYEGQMRYRKVLMEENIGRLNYRKDDYIDYLDGDIESSIYYNDTEGRKNDINTGRRDPKLVVYQSEHERYELNGVNGEEPTDLKGNFDKGWPTTLISDRSRVYKGGSWEDRAYWMGTGTRRFLDERQSTRNIGFRCAMDRVGSPTGKNYGKKKKRKS